jgi:hypothetical protein
MKTLRSADICIGVLLELLGAFLLIGALHIPGTEEQRLRPGAAPILLSCATMAAGFALLIKGCRYKGPPATIDWPRGKGMICLLVTALSITLYFGTIEFLGFPLSSALFGSFLCWYLGRFPVWVPLLLGAGSGAVILFAFIRFLGFGFPLGLLQFIL